MAVAETLPCLPNYRGVPLRYRAGNAAEAEEGGRQAGGGHCPRHRVPNRSESGERGESGAGRHIGMNQEGGTQEGRQ